MIVTWGALPEYMSMTMSLLNVDLCILANEDASRHCPAAIGVSFQIDALLAIDRRDPLEPLRPLIYRSARSAPTRHIYHRRRTIKRTFTLGGRL